MFVVPVSDKHRLQRAQIEAGVLIVKRIVARKNNGVGMCGLGLSRPLPEERRGEFVKGPSSSGHRCNSFHLLSDHRSRKVFKALDFAVVAQHEQRDRAHHAECPLSALQYLSLRVGHLFGIGHIYGVAGRLPASRPSVARGEHHNAVIQTHDAQKALCVQFVERVVFGLHGSGRNVVIDLKHPVVAHRLQQPKRPPHAVDAPLDKRDVRGQ